MKKLLLLLVSAFSGLAVISSFSVKNTDSDNISTWYLFYNKKELINSNDPKLWTRDTSAFISIDPDSLKKEDSLHFNYSFDVLGLDWRTRLYLGTTGGTKVLMSDMKNYNFGKGDFAADGLMLVSGLLQTHSLVLFCSTNDGPAQRLINIKLEKKSRP